MAINQNTTPNNTLAWPEKSEGAFTVNYWTVGSEGLVVNRIGRFNSVSDAERYIKSVWPSQSKQKKVA